MSIRPRILVVLAAAALCNLITSCATSPSLTTRRFAAGTTLTINSACIACHADRTTDRQELRELCTAN
jgi:hypothetical protein